MGKALESEADIQRRIVDFLSTICNKYSFMFFSVPNEALGRGKDRRSNAIRMNMLKSLGLVPGAADIVIVRKGRAFFVEVKGPGGRQTENQKNFELWCRRCGAPYAVVHSLTELTRTFSRWGVMHI